MEKTVSAVLVAAGSSTRMGFDKLSFDLGGETVLHRSIRAFAQCPQITELVLVAGKNREFVAQQAADKATADARAEQRAKLAEAEKQAEAEGQKLFDAIMAENAERADSERAAAAKKLYAAAEYIIGKAGQA
jgi:2-C-methyl-D-erythritol 4-phosphate cytidylyltransferase